MPIEGLVLKMFLDARNFGELHDAGRLYCGRGRRWWGHMSRASRGQQGPRSNLFQCNLYSRLSIIHQRSHCICSITTTKARSITNMKLLALNFFHTNTYRNEIKHQKHLSTKNNCDSNPLSRPPGWRVT